ncbi:MAG: NAD(P)-dependent alcohol dehydrogenase [Myxococcales bacterium]|nr:NAD(P)-dependent alcohol dehydrogenase [Myxococcales bacterium]
MKAVVFSEYGPPQVLHVAEVATPVPKAREVLIRIHATSVNFGDMVVRNFKAITPSKFHMPMLFWLIGRVTFGLRRPRVHVLGSEFAGEIVSVGSRVTLFKPGDQVFGYRGPRMGAYAEYLCMPERGVVTAKPANLSFAEAAAVPYGALMALSMLRKLDLQPGQRVLVNGASGGIGPSLVQLARSHFHADVTGVCSTARLGYVRALGADTVIDYTKEDFTASGQTYDVIIDVLGRTPFARSKRALRPKGRCLLVSFKAKHVFQMLWTSLFGDKRLICAMSSETQDDLRLIKVLVEAGTLTPIVDRCFPLEEAAEAHRYVEAGQRRGSVVLVGGT